MNRLLLCGAAAAVLGGSAFGQTIVVPNANATVAGNDTSGPLPSSPIPLRNQIVINSGQFPTGPIFITGFTWRAKPGTGALNVTMSGTVSLSTSSKVANTPPGPQISTTFASNIGPDNTVVATLSGFTMSGAGCAIAGTTPCPFANNITLTTPFAYNQANGSLLADLSLTSIASSTSSQFDVQNCNANVANCVVNNVSAAPPTATGGLNNSNNVTQITYTTSLPGTPVPPSILLTLAGLAVVGFYVGTRGVKFA